MKKLKNGCHFFNIDHMEKFQISDPPKVCVSIFLSVNGNGMSASAIMKKLKNGCHFFNIDHTEKFQIIGPPQSLGLQFSSHQKTGDANSIFFLNFPLVYFSSSPILGSISTFVATLKTFMHGHLCISGLPLKSPMCSFTLPYICVIFERNIVSHKNIKIMIILCVLKFSWDSGGVQWFKRSKCDQAIQCLKWHGAKQHGTYWFLKQHSPQMWWICHLIPSNCMKHHPNLYQSNFHLLWECHV